MEKIIDRASDIFSEVLSNPSRYYYYLIRWIQISSGFSLLLFWFSTARTVHALDFDLSYVGLESLVFWTLLPVVGLIVGQSAIRLMVKPSPRAVTSVLLTCLINLLVSPLGSVLLLLVMFTPAFKKLVEGNEPPWYSKIVNELTAES